MAADQQAWAVVSIVRGEEEIVLGTVCAQRADLDLVDRLARMELAARRSGWRLRLRDVDADLSALIDLVGLAEVLAG